MRRAFQIFALIAHIGLGQQVAIAQVTDKLTCDYSTRVVDETLSCVFKGSYTDDEGTNPMYAVVCKSYCLNWREHYVDCPDGYKKNKRSCPTTADERSIELEIGDIEVNGESFYSTMDKCLSFISSGSARTWRDLCTASAARLKCPTAASDVRTCSRLPTPTPSPTPSPSPMPSPSPTAWPSPSPTPGPTSPPTPRPSPSPMSTVSPTPSPWPYASPNAWMG